MTAPGRSGGAGGSIVALCGGVGGTKLALGLSRHLGRRLKLIVNTGDDFEHLGLAISPDIDTVLYTLSGLANRELGWGRRDETWNFMAALGDIGGETWFRLGDRDLALHVERTRRLGAGESLTSVVRDLAACLGIEPEILPMCDDPIRTMVATPEGVLPFQRYFVERRCAPCVIGISFEGAGEARPSDAALSALGDPELRAIVICPSNPFLSIDPILSAPGIRARIEAANAPTVAVSPIIGGKAVKGPTDKIMAELGIPATSAAIAAHYDGLLHGMVIDVSDAAEEVSLPGRVLVTNTLMKDDVDRERLAAEVIAFAGAIASDRAARTARS
jgi:LPPG:FO 2-phospho-L-lactate transferase